MSFRGLVKKFIPAGLFKKIEPWGHLAEAMLVQTIYGFPAKNLKIIGVTGTDGKTSTSTFIAQMLRTSGYKVAMMTTVAVDYGTGEQANPTRMTTISALELAKAFKKIKRTGADWLVLEATSHALAQHRVWGVPFEIAVVTNLSHEHLDYHGSFEKYREAKLRLFKMTAKNRRGQKIGIVNADDEAAQLFASAVPKPITYGINSGELRAIDVKSTPSGSSFKIEIRATSTHSANILNVAINLPGGFNVYNALAAASVGFALNIDPRRIEKGLASLEAVAGRMTHVDEGQDFAVIVDYAHTPDSFQKILMELKPVVKGRIITMFGSAGRRDEAKRAQQGMVAGKYSDIVIVTEEDDRDIDGQEILEQIASGAKSSGKVEDDNLFLIHRREDAVAKAISLAKAGDLVLLLGKGHETNIITAGPDAAKLRHLPQDDDDPNRVIKRPYNEVAVAQEALKNLKNL
jgi:UDP-N-acetylmuramoyl-L-alanyl-D-glutamate--2,6-diaminopimelate ligase